MRLEARVSLARVCVRVGRRRCGDSRSWQRRRKTETDVPSRQLVNFRWR